MATATCSAFGMACSFHVALSYTSSGSVSVYTSSPLRSGCHVQQHIAVLPERSQPNHDACRGQQPAGFTGGHRSPHRHGIPQTHRSPPPPHPCPPPPNRPTPPRPPPPPPTRQ